MIAAAARKRGGHLSAEDIKRLQMELERHGTRKANDGYGANAAPVVEVAAWLQGMVEEVATGSAGSRVQ